MLSHISLKYYKLLICESKRNLTKKVELDYYSYLSLAILLPTLVPGTVKGTMGIFEPSFVPKVNYPLKEYYYYFFLFFCISRLKMKIERQIEYYYI